MSIYRNTLGPISVGDTVAYSRGHGTREALTVTKVSRVWAEATNPNGATVKFNVNHGAAKHSAWGDGGRVDTPASIADATARTEAFTTLKQHGLEPGFGGTHEHIPTETLTAMAALLDGSETD